MKILLTSTSFQDYSGTHQERLKQSGFEIVTLRGPVSKEVLIPIMHEFDGIICGDDELSREVIKIGAENKLKIISKYGVGLDKIDLDAAKEFGVPVTNCLGMNHETVSEHTLALILAYFKNIHLEYQITKSGQWKRLVGHEIKGMKLGILGFGKIGKELAKRSKAFGLDVSAYDPYMDEKLASSLNVIVRNGVEELVRDIDILSIHVPLLDSTLGMLNAKTMAEIKENLVIVNTSRALVIDQGWLLSSLENKRIGAYLTDVLDVEPMPEDHPLLKFDNVLITPHIGSRTYESIERQGNMAVDNLLNALDKSNL